MNEKNILLFEELPSESSDLLPAEETPVESSSSSESDSVEDVEETFPEESFPQESSPTPSNAIYVDGDVVLSMAETESDIPAVYAIEPDEVELPYHAVTVLWNDQIVAFPSSYADDLSISGGILVNTGASVSVGVDLRSSASVPGTYVITMVTVPTYNSNTYYQYLAEYGAPYRLVDYYVYSGSYRSFSRDSSTVLDFTGAELSGYRGFGNSTMAFFILGLIVIFLLVINRFRRI